MTWGNRILKLIHILFGSSVLLTYIEDQQF